MAAKKTTTKSTKKKSSAKRTTAKRTTAPRNAPSSTFSAEERAAMKEYARELKASKTKEAGEAACREAIAKMKEPDRAMAKRVHAIVTGAAPELAPRTWYGMPAYAKDDKVLCFFKTRRSSSRGTRRSASATRRASTRAGCGRPRSR